VGLDTDENKIIQAMRSKSPNVDVSQSSSFSPTFPGFDASRLQDLSHLFKNQKKQLGG
jgi:hypothetical protein